MCCCDRKTGIQVVSFKLGEDASRVDAKGAFEVRLYNAGAVAFTLWGSEKIEPEDEKSFCSPLQTPFMEDIPLNWPDGATGKKEIRVLLFKEVQLPKDWYCDPRTDNSL